MPLARDHDVLAVAYVRDRSHPLSLRVVDADLRTHVAARVEVQHLHVPVDRAPLAELVDADPRLVVVRHHDDTRPHLGDHAAEGLGHRPPLVEQALGLVGARVDPLAGNAVVLGRVPGHQRLPDVVVREVAVLVVRRVEVREVTGREGVGDVEGIRPQRGARTRQQLRHAQRQGCGRARRPLLHVRHLHTGGRVDPVGGLDQAGQQQRVAGRPRVVALDGVAHRVDPGAVLGPEEARPHAERVGEVARRRREARSGRRRHRPSSRRSTASASVATYVCANTSE